MGRKGENSWLTAVKRVFWPPFKNSEKRPELDDEESKKKEKRRWVFRTSQSQEQLQMQPPPPPPSPPLVLEDQIYTAVAATEPLAHFPPEYYAAIIIQTVFRGFLARRALRALKGLVKLQALVRGRNVRKQADMTLKCLQSLVRVQARFREQRIRLSHSLDVATPCIKSSSIAQRRYMAMVNGRNEVAMEGEEANSYASPYQIWRSDCYLSHMEEEEGQRRRIDQWMASRTSFSNRNRGRASMDRRDPIKTVEIDTPRSFLSPTPRRQLRYTCHNLSSPLRRSPATPSPSKAKPLQERCSSSMAAAHSTSLMAIPNYMVATESVLARLRPVSVPLQRAVSPEKERAVPAKKRLSFPPPEIRSRNSVSSPSYKSAMGRLVSEQRSNLSSSCAESLGSEISPASTEDLRRWLR